MVLYTQTCGSGWSKHYGLDMGTYQPYVHVGYVTYMWQSQIEMYIITYLSAGRPETSKRTSR